jgi:hypothetical protein
METKKFNITNANDFSEIYMHDAEFLGFNFIYEHSKIEMTATNNFPTKTKLFLTFNNVLYFKSLNGALWGKGNNIFSCDVKKSNETDIEFLLCEDSFSEHRENIRGIIPNLLKVEILLNSGDLTVIFCSEIDVNIC